MYLLEFWPTSSTLTFGLRVVNFLTLLFLSILLVQSISLELYLSFSLTERNKQTAHICEPFVYLGRLERIELSMPVPQTGVLPLNYSRHVAHLYQLH